MEPEIDIEPFLADPGRPGPNDVVFIQYRRPRGEARLIWTTRSPEIVSLSDRLRLAGCRLEIEVLRDGTVSLTVDRDQDDDTDPTLAIELSPNDSRLSDAVDRVIIRAAARAGLV